MTDRLLRRSEAYALIAAEQGRLKRLRYSNGSYVDYIDGGFFSSSRAADSRVLAGLVDAGWLVDPAPNKLTRAGFAEFSWQLTQEGREVLIRYRSSPPPREKFTGKRKRDTGEKK